MATRVKQKHGGEIIKLQKGETNNPNGRPRKFVSELRAQGYRIAEVNDAIQVMLSMTIEELGEVWKNPKATVLEKTIAAAIRKSIEKGSLYSIETLLTRVYGKPRESIDVKSEEKIVITLGK
jgi:hypothetical protein